MTDDQYRLCEIAEGFVDFSLNAYLDHMGDQFTRWFVAGQKKSLSAAMELVRLMEGKILDTEGE